MKKIVAYLLCLLALCVILLLLDQVARVPAWYSGNVVLIRCTLIGTIGGLIYLLRAVYLHKALHKDWDRDWHIWYYLRPITSAISGGVSYIFLKAGLLVLEATPEADSTCFGYFAIAFIAGYNVDNFMKKIESIAQTVWGIQKSRVARDLHKADEKGADGRDPHP